MFVRMIKSLRGLIEFFCFHGREAIVLEILWDEVIRKNKTATPEQRRDKLISIINKLYEDKPNG